MMEYVNWGKCSVGIDIFNFEGVELFYEIVKDCDVFIMNYLLFQCQKLKIDLEYICVVNLNIIYVCGSVYGDKGLEWDIGGFDGMVFWLCSGVGYFMLLEELGQLLVQGIVVFGDFIGGMNIVGGIFVVLFYCVQIGEISEVDVFLLSIVWWVVGLVVDFFIEKNDVMCNCMFCFGGNLNNLFIGNYVIFDGGIINLCMIILGNFIKDIFIYLGILEVVDDE